MQLLPTFKVRWLFNKKKISFETKIKKEEKLVIFKSAYTVKVKSGNCNFLTDFRRKYTKYQSNNKGDLTFPGISSLQN
jgi:hypothetical protein